MSQVQDQASSLRSRPPLACPLWGQACTCTSTYTCVLDTQVKRIAVTSIHTWWSPATLVVGGRLRVRPQGPTRCVGGSAGNLWQGLH